MKWFTHVIIPTFFLSLLGCERFEVNTTQPVFVNDSSILHEVDPPLPPPQEASTVPLTQVTPSETAQKILTAAEAYEGQPYVFGGRLGRAGCRRKGQAIRCRPGIDCQSLIFFAFEDVLGTKWWDFSVMPTINVKRNELGHPVSGVNGVLREDLDASKLAPGDVLFFLFEGYNLDVDGPLHVVGDRKFGTWHTGFFHGASDGTYWVLHAAPGEHVKRQPLDEISFDALFAVRM